jgi:hypothetical protein
MSQGGRVKGGSTWELDSVLLSMYLPTYICCLSLVCQCWEIATQSVPTHCKTCRQNWPVGTENGDISPCWQHVADICSQVSELFARMQPAQVGTPNGVVRHVVKYDMKSPNYLPQHH